MLASRWQLAVVAVACWLIRSASAAYCRPLALPQGSTKACLMGEYDYSRCTFGVVVQNDTLLQGPGALLSSGDEQRYCYAPAATAVGFGRFTGVAPTYIGCPAGSYLPKIDSGSSWDFDPATSITLTNLSAGVSGFSGSTGGFGTVIHASGSLVAVSSPSASPRKKISIFASDLDSTSTVAISHITNTGKPRVTTTEPLQVSAFLSDSTSTSNSLVTVSNAFPTAFNAGPYKVCTNVKITNIIASNPVRVYVDDTYFLENDEIVSLVGVVGTVNTLLSMSNINGDKYMVKNVDAASKFFDLHAVDETAWDGTIYAAYAYGGMVTFGESTVKLDRVAFGGDPYTSGGLLTRQSSTEELVATLEDTVVATPGWGDSLAVSGGTVVVGAPASDAAFVYDRNHGGGGSFGLVRRLAVSGGSGSKFGYSVTSCDDGEFIAVGAPDDAQHSAQAGRVYIFGRNVGGHNAYGLRVTLEGEEQGAQMGYSLSSSSDLLVVGAPFAGPVNTGKVYIHGVDTGGHRFFGRMKTLNGAAETETFGYSLSSDGGQVVIGAPAFSNTNRQGRVAVHYRDQGGQNMFGSKSSLSGVGFGHKVSAAHGTFAMITRDNSEQKAVKFFALHPTSQIYVDQDYVQTSGTPDSIAMAGTGYPASTGPALFSGKGDTNTVRIQTLGLSTCQTCTSGTSVYGSSSCGCAPGTTGAAASCAACSSGYFKAVTGAASCEACPANSEVDSAFIDLATVPVTSCTASSTFSASYLCANAFNNQVGEWATSAEGVNSWIQAQFESSVYISSFMYQQRPGNTEWNKDVTLKFSDDTEQTFVLAESAAVQTFAITPIATAQVRITVDSVYATSNNGAVSIHFVMSPDTAATSCVCSAGFTRANDGSCTVCPSGKFKALVGGYECQNCAAGTYKSSAQQVSDSCDTCASNASSLPGSTAENDCIANDGYTGSGGSTAACAVGTYKSLSMSAAPCILCGQGKYNALTAQTAESACINCGIGKFNRQMGTGEVESTSCTSCPVGTYGDGPAQTACISCNAGKYSTATAATSVASCLSCPSINSYSPTASALLTDCSANAGFTGSGSSVTACAPGTFKQAKLSDAACDQCPTGKYNNVPGQIVELCLICPAGKYNDELGMTSLSDCKDCPMGQYQEETAAAGCTSCEVGKYLSVSGSSLASQCEACPGGTFKTLTGQTQESSCTSCPTNTNSSAGSDAASDCLCNAGMYLPAGQGSCVACGSGWYKLALSNVACTDCRDSTYGFGTGSGGCQSCPAGLTAFAGGNLVAADCRPDEISLHHDALANAANEMLGNVAAVVPWPSSF